jgi:hypothetical protein
MAEFRLFLPDDARGIIGSVDDAGQLHQDGRTAGKRGGSPMSKFEAGEVCVELIQELRDLAARGADVPELVGSLQQRLELDDTNAVLPSIVYFRAAFALSLREALPLREWLGGRDRSEIDSILVPAMQRFLSRRQTRQVLRA